MTEAEVREAIFNKDWTGKRCAGLRQLCHTISVTHGAVFREVVVLMVLMYTILLVTQTGKGEDCPPKFVVGTARPDEDYLGDP